MNPQSEQTSSRSRSTGVIGTSILVIAALGGAVLFAKPGIDANAAARVGAVAVDGGSPRLHRQRAFENFAALADLGHPGAAHIAIRRSGSAGAVAGQPAAADATMQQQRWAAVAACPQLAGRTGCLLRRQRG